MPYGSIKVDNIIFTNSGADQTTTVSGLYAAITSGVTVSGTISGTTIQGQTISGVTVTGTTANFTSGVFTTQISGATVTGTTANFTSGNFTALSGASTTVTSGIFAIGSAAAPSISFASDPNTGIYSPGADQVAISTGGSGKLFVDASGNVAISQVISPSYTKSFNVIAVNASIALRANSAGTYSDQGIFFAVDAVNYAQIYNSDIGQLIFRTGSGLSERLRITSAGLVGIGTSSPDANLDVVRGSSGTVATFGIEGLTTNPRLRIDVDESNNTVSFNPNYSGATSPSIVFKTTEIERCRLDASGRLLVGTSTARANFNNSTVSAVLQVEGTTATNRIASLVSSTASGATGAILAFGKQNSGTLGGNTVVASGDNLGNIQFQGSDGTEFVEAASITAFVDGTPGANDMPGRLVFNTTADGAASPTERLRITSAGLVGIGTTSPGQALEVLGTIYSQNNATSIVHFQAADTGAAANEKTWRIAQSQRAAKSIQLGIALNDASSVANAAITIVRSGATLDNIQFATGSGSERARIDSSGRLLVGTSTSALEKLVVLGDGGGIQINRNQTGSPTSGQALGSIGFKGIVSANSNTAAEVLIQASADEAHSGLTAGSRLEFHTKASGVGPGSSPTEALRITNDRVIAYNQPTPTSKSAAATLTITELKTGIIQYTGAVATLTLPTGTLMEGGFSGIYTNMAFEWSVINTGAGICTVAAGTDHTVIGSGTVAIGDSARFVSRRTAANTFVSYRLS